MRALADEARIKQFMRETVAIEPRLYRYPAIVPEAFRTAMRDAFGEPPSTRIRTC